MAKKTLTLTLRQLVPMNTILNALAVREDLPITTSFRLGNMLKQANAHFETFEAARQSIVKRHGDLIEVGPEFAAAAAAPQYRIRADEQEAANATMEALVAETVTITGWRPLTLADFGDAKGLRPADFLALGPLLDIDALIDGDDDEEEDEAASDTIDPNPAA